MQRNRTFPFLVPDGGTNPSGAPQAGATPAPTPQAGEPPPANPSGTDTPKPSSRSVDDLEKEIAALRKENAERRVKLTAFEKAQADAEAAKLTELEKAKKAQADAEAKATQHEREMQELRVTVSIERQASKLGIVDSEAAAKLLDWSEIEYDDAGKPKNIDKLLEKLAKDKPYLVGKPGAATSGGASNPPKSQSGGALSKEAIERMSPGEYRARRDEIYAWLRQQK
jgi:hypothetical protein